MCGSNKKDLGVNNGLVMVNIKATEYERLLEDQKVLRALEAAGVDNWEGFEIAMEPWCDD